MTIAVDLSADGSPRPSVLTVERALSIAIALAIGVGLVGAVQSFGPHDARLARSLALGALFGIVLQRSRFCFLCHMRDLIENRDPRGVTAILLALGVGTLGYFVVLSAWLPDPGAGRLPPDAHVGPSGPVLGLAAFVFGIGMALSGSCISGHLYRLGEGSSTAPFALLGTVIGFAAGFQTWNHLYVRSIAETPVVWLPAHLGYPAWLLFQLTAFVGLAGVIAWFSRNVGQGVGRKDVSVLRHASRRIFKDRWPATVGGAAVGVVATVAYFQVQPLGVTAAIGSAARLASAQLNILPETLHGLDGYAGCRTVSTGGLSANGAFVLGLVCASFASALVAAQFRPSLPTVRQVVRGTIGGVLLGWGAMTAIGCTVGTLLSGTIAGAASGWIFLIASFAGVWASLHVLRRIKAG